MKNTTAQNVDPDRVEMASGYRMKTRPAPARHSEDLTNGRDHWSEMQVVQGPGEAQAAPDQPTALLSHVRTEKTKALKTTGKGSSDLRFLRTPRSLPSSRAEPGQLWATRCQSHLLHTMRGPLTLKSWGSSESVRDSSSPSLIFLWPQNSGKKRGHRLQSWPCQGQSAGAVAG